MSEPDSEHGDHRRRTATNCGKWYVVSALLLVIGISNILACLPTAARRTDFSHYYVTAKLLLAGADPYSEPLLPHCEANGVEYEETIPIGAHPPLLLRMFACIAWLPLDRAYVVWAAVSACCAVTMLMLTRWAIGFERGSPLSITFASFVICSTAMSSHWRFSQVQLLIGTLLFAAYYFQVNRRHGIACSLAALAACLKLYPVVLLPWFAFTGATKRKDIIYRSLCMIAIVVLVLGATGIDQWHGFITRGLPVIQDAGTSYSNFSLQVVIERYVHSLLADATPAALGAMVKAAAACAFLAAYYAIWRHKFTELVAFSLLVTLMVLLSPVAWGHYLVLMMLPAAVLMQHSREFSSPLLRGICMAVAGMCLMPYLDRLLLPDTISPWRVAVHIYPVYCLLAATLLLISLPRRRLSASFDAQATSPPMRGAVPAC